MFVPWLLLLYDIICRDWHLYLQAQALEPCVAQGAYQFLVGCPGCGGSNFCSFRFCQWCGRKRAVAPLPACTTVVEESAVRTRREFLERSQDDKKHSKAKHDEFSLLMAFVSSRKSDALRRHSATDILPTDVMDFVVFRDLSGAGRTIVHIGTCVSRSPDGTCGCPVRMSSETVRTLISKLRTRFYELGCGGPWAVSTGTGNPADSGPVRKIQNAVKEEQAQAGCHVQSARRRALLPGKLALLVQFLEGEASSAIRAKNRVRYLTIRRDLAWICVQYRSLNRGAELSALKIGNTLLGPNGSCVVFQFGWSKVLRGSASTEFAVAALPGDPTCPVDMFTSYVNTSQVMFGWDWDASDGAYVFPLIARDGSRSAKQLTAGNFGGIFRRYLSAASLLESESLHGLRAAGALTMALRGDSITDIMLQGYWKSPVMARRYVGLLRLVAGDAFDREMVAVGAVAPPASESPDGVKPGWR